MAKVEKDIKVSEIIKRRKYNLAVAEGYKSLLMRIIVLIIAAYIIFTQVFLVTQNHGMGMFPAVKDGDLILAYRLQSDYSQDDVVVYEQNGELYVGRIVADEYDVVNINDTGSLEVNNMPHTGEILFSTVPSENSNLTYPYKVPEGSVFILGDYRTQTEDSRDFGAIKMDQIKGKVITLIRRRGL